MKGMPEKMEGRLKRRAAAALAATLAALAFGASLLLPARIKAEQPPPPPPPAVVQMADAPCDAPLPGPDAAADRTHSQRRRRTLAAARSTCQVIGSFLITAAVRLLTFLLSALAARLLGAPIATLLAFLGDVLVVFLLMALLFAWLFKRLFPDRRLRDLLTGRNLLWMLAGSVLISAVRALLPRLGGEANAVCAVAEAVLSVLLFAGVWLLLYCRDDPNGARARRSARGLLRSRPVAAAFLLLAAGSALTAYLRTSIPAVGRLEAFLSFSALFLLCFFVCAAVAAVYTSKRRSTQA